MQSRHIVKVPDPKPTAITVKNLINISEHWSRPDAPAQYLWKLRTLLMYYHNHPMEDLKFKNSSFCE